MSVTNHHPRYEEQGRVRDLGPDAVLAALGAVREGRIYDLEVTRFRGMPLHPAHPQMEVITFRSPRGTRNQGDQTWLEENNSEGVRFISEVVSGTVHSGTHIDAFSHITVGPDDSWYGGFSANDWLGDWGPIKSDASSIPPIITRAVLLDVAKHRGVPVMQAGEGISGDDLQATMEAQGTEIRDGDAVLIRTGYVSLFPDAESMGTHFGPGIDKSAALWLAEKGIVAVGGDTESLEQIPCLDPSNPHAVHTVLLAQNGIHMIEMLDLEQLSRDDVHEFTFVVLPLKIQGATGSMVRPIAIV